MSGNGGITDEQRERLTAYLDGELVHAQRKEVDRLVGRDPALARELESLRRAWAALDALKAPEPGEGFAQRVVARAERAGRRRYRRVMAWGASAAVVAAGVLAAAVLWRGLGQSVPPPSPRTPTLIAEQDRPFVEGLAQVESLYHELARDRQGRVDVAKELAFLKALDEAGIFAEDDRDNSL